MELGQIRYFTTLARLLNFTRAAEACNVTQPALTRAIQRLEDELGGRLIHRERSLTQLTELGRAMLPLLERAQEAAQTARAQAAAFRERRTSPLRLGIDASLPSELLTPVLAELSRNAELDLTMQQSESGVLAERVLAGEIEAAVLVESALPERLHRWPLFEERHVVLCTPGHAFAALETVPVAALAEERVLLRAAADTLRGAFAAMCEAAGFEPRPRSAGDSEAQLQEMVKLGLGVTLAGERAPVSPPLLARPLAAPAQVRRIVLAAAAGRAHGPTLSLFLTLMRARAWSAPA